MPVLVVEPPVVVDAVVVPPLLLPLALPLPPAPPPLPVVVVVVACEPPAFGAWLPPPRAVPLPPPEPPWVTVDGAFGAFGAALLRPCADAPVTPTDTTASAAARV